MSLYVKYLPQSVASGGGGGSVTTGDLTESGSPNLTVTNGAGAVIGSGTVLTLTGSTMLETVSSVLTITGGTNAVLGTGVTIQVKQASTSQSGYLSNTDWNTFNGKQASGSYITSLTGEATASGPGASAVTLTNSAVIGKVLTGYTSGSGTVAATDTILGAFQKLNGNDGLKLNIASPAFTGTLSGATISVTGGVTSTSQVVANSNAAAYVSSQINNTDATGFTQLGMNIGAAGAAGQGGVFYVPGTFFRIGVVGNDTATPFQIVTNSGNTVALTLTSAGNATIAGTLRVNGGDTANGTTASVFTPASGPTGAHTAIQGWIALNINGTVRYLPYW